MSRLTETKRAYDRISRLLDDAIRNRRGQAGELEKFREILNVAFYLLGWGQFEHLVRNEANEVINEHARSKGIERHAWGHLQGNLGGLSVRKRLDLIFDAQPEVRNSLDKDYSVRNEAAHNYKQLPPEARDISAWLQKLEELVEKFDR